MEKTVDNTFTMAQQLDLWESKLRAAGVECAGIESEWIYCFVTKKSRNELFFDRDMPCSLKFIQAGDAIVERRILREPLQYIFGNAPFMELELNVTPDVLIPRPETEILAEFLRKELPLNGRLLDVGTGSGAIAIATAYGREDAEVVAVDISDAALNVARGNCEKYSLNSRIKFLKSDLLESLKGEKFNIVAANLPYISESEYVDLEPEVKDFEPKLALTADDEGLALIFRLVDELPNHLEQGGLAIFEIGESQAERLSAYLSKKWESRILKDYNQTERFVIAKKR